MAPSGGGGAHEDLFGRRLGVVEVEPAETNELVQPERRDVTRGGDYNGRFGSERTPPPPGNPRNFAESSLVVNKQPDTVSEPGDSGCETCSPLIRITLEFSPHHLNSHNFPSRKFEQKISHFISVAKATR